MVAFVMTIDLRVLNYAIEGTSSSSTWKARRHPFLSVLASASIFSFACHEPFITQLPIINSIRLTVAGSGIAAFSDSSAPLITHCNHHAVICGPARFVSQLLHYFAFIIDDDSEISASYTLPSIVLGPDATNSAGIFAIIPTALAADSLTFFVFISRAQLVKTFCIIIWLGDRIPVRHRRPLAIATPNHDSSFPWGLVSMGLIQVIVTKPFITLFGHSAPFTVITDATRITESVHPDSVLTTFLDVHALLVIHQINSDILYHARLCVTSIFDTLARNITVSVLSNIQVPTSSAFTADVTMRDAIIVEFLVIEAWGAPSAEELREFLERGLDIAFPGFQNLYIRSIGDRPFNIDKVLNINQIEMENMRLHQGNLINTTLEDIPDFVSASSPKTLDSCVQIALRHYMRNHRSDIGTNTEKARPNSRISEAILSRGSLIAAESVCFSIRAITRGDDDGVFVHCVNINRNPNVCLAFSSVPLFNLYEAIGVFSFGNVVSLEKLFRSLAILHTRVQINAFQYDPEVSQIEAHTFSLVKPHGLDEPIGGLNRLECIMEISTRKDARTDRSYVRPGGSKKNHLNVVSDATGLPKLLVLRRGSSSRSSEDLDTMILRFLNTPMGTVQVFDAPPKVGKFGTGVLEDSGAMLDASPLHQKHQALEDEVSGTTICVSGICEKDMRTFDGLRHLDNVRGLLASRIIDEFSLTGPAIKRFPENSSVFFKPINPLLYPTPVTSDERGSIVLSEDISPFDRSIVSNACLKLHLSLNSTFITASSGLPFEANAVSTGSLQNSKTSKLLAPAPDTYSQMFPVVSQYPAQDNAYVAIFETPISQLANAIRGHCVGGIPLCPAYIYLEQVFVGLERSCRHLCIPTEDKLVVLRALEFLRPLVYSEPDSRIVLTQHTLQDDSHGTFFVASEGGGTNQRSIHVRGEYRTDRIPRTVTKFQRTLPIINRRISSILKAQIEKTPQLFSTRTVYEVIFSRVVQYSKEYQTIQSLTVDPTGLEGYACVKLPALDERRRKPAIHHVFIDTLLHVPGFLANLQGGANDAYICSRVDSIRMIAAQIEDDATYGVYCSQCWFGDQGIMLAEAYAVKLGDPQILVARLKGIHFRKVRLNSLKRGLVHAVEGPTSHLHLHPIHPKAQPVPGLPPSTPVRFSSVKVTTDSQNTGLPAPAFPLGNRPASNVCGARTCVFEEGARESILSASNEDVQARHTPVAFLNDCVEDIGEDDNLEKLRLRTSTSLEILTALRTKFGIKVPEQFFKDCPTLKKVQSYPAPHRSFQGSQSPAKVASPKIAVKRLVSNDEPKPKVPFSSITVARLTKALKLDEIPLPLQRSTSASLPLFLIHDGSGLISYYNGIPSLGRQVWGINNPHFISSEPWRGVVEMATFYANHIARVATGPIIVGGWSFGGVVAYETSLQLAKEGTKTQGVLLIDSPNPINHIPLSEDLINSIVNLDARSAKSDLGNLVKAQFTLSAEMLSQYDPRQTGGTCPPLVLLRSSEGFDPPGISDVPRWLADRSDAKTATFGWENLTCGPTKVLDIPGHHFTPFKPANIKRVSERMMEACALFEAE